MGYHLGETEEELRSDILLLLKTLSSNTKIKESQLIMPSREYNKIEFPLEAHISIIKDFYKYGYYTETKKQKIIKEQSQQQSMHTQEHGVSKKRNISTEL